MRENASFRAKMCIGKRPNASRVEANVGFDLRIDRRELKLALLDAHAAWRGVVPPRSRSAAVRSLVRLVDCCKDDTPAFLRRPSLRGRARERPCRISGPASGVSSFSWI
eukprot:4090126-Ditylum_brightwellii.AAC.1